MNNKLKVICNHCNSHFTIERPKIILAFEQPKLRDAIIYNDYFKFNCPYCGKKIFRYFNFVYQDDLHKFIIIFGNENYCIKKFESLKRKGICKKYKVCGVLTKRGLIELIQILEADKDIRILGITKAILKRNIMNGFELLYTKLDDGQLGLVIYDSNYNFVGELKYAMDYFEKLSLKYLFKIKDINFIFSDEEYFKLIE